jgi:5-formyltetrahydrofolate cyclo-ligase
MQFRQWDNPFDESVLTKAPYGGLQLTASAEETTIDVAIVPLLGFTVTGQRLGQGGGHYDRYLAEHPTVIAVGIGWDCQLVDALPIEPHDQPLRAVVTPTRFYGPF